MNDNGFHWTCPFCGRDTTITTGITSGGVSIWDRREERRLFMRCVVIACPSPHCMRFEVTAQLGERYINEDDMAGPPIQTWRLIPTSRAKSFPEFVPAPIREDYEEACSIQELSPKASATLSRRCLQGMIRDFWNVKTESGRLFDEINAIKDRVDPETWETIHAVRKVGNVGAHMESDINMVVDVEPGEAGLLIGLIESLIEEWYVARHKRRERNAAILSVAESKKAGAIPMALPLGPHGA